MSQRDDQDWRRFWQGVGRSALIMSPIYLSIIYMLVWR